MGGVDPVPDPSRRYLPQSVDGGSREWSRPDVQCEDGNETQDPDRTTVGSWGECSGYSEVSRGWCPPAR